MINYGMVSQTKPPNICRGDTVYTYIFTFGLSLLGRGQNTREGETIFSDSHHEAQSTMITKDHAKPNQRHAQPLWSGARAANTRDGIFVHTSNDVKGPFAVFPSPGHWIRTPRYDDWPGCWARWTKMPWSKGRNTTKLVLFSVTYHNNPISVLYTAP